MPQPCTTRRPCLSKSRIIASGAAAPPTTMRMPDGSFQRAGSCSSACRMPAQIVGTPAVSVTCSDWYRSSRLAASRCGPGNTSFAPIITAVNGMPQALTWNIGTTGHTQSRLATPI